MSLWIQTENWNKSTIFTFSPLIFCESVSQGYTYFVSQMVLLFDYHQLSSYVRQFSSLLLKNIATLVCLVSAGEICCLSTQMEREGRGLNWQFSFPREGCILLQWGLYSRQWGLYSKPVPPSATFYDDELGSELPNVIVTSHTWLLSLWNVASVLKL